MDRPKSIRRTAALLAALAAGFAIWSPSASAFVDVPGTNWTLEAYTPYYMSPAGYPWGTWQGKGKAIGATTYVSLQVCRSVLVSGGWHQDLCQRDSGTTYFAIATTGGFPINSCQWTATWTGIAVLWNGSWHTAGTRSPGLRFC